MEQIRTNKSKVNLSLEEAVNHALTDMPNDFVSKPFLMAHQAEVKGMLLTEYNEVEQMELFLDAAAQAKMSEDAFSAKMKNL